MTNKFLISSLLFCFFAISNLSAQKLGLRAEFGLQNMASQSTYLVSANKQVDYKLTTLDVTPSRSIGLYSQFDFGWLFFQPEFLYTTYSQSLSLEAFSEEAGITEATRYTENFQQFDIPVFAGVKYNIVKIGVGPVIHIGQNIDSDLAQFNKIEIKPTSVRTGFQAGIGFDLKYFNLDLKYQREFNQATDHINFNGSNNQLKGSLSSFRLGIAFALGNK